MEILQVQFFVIFFWLQKKGKVTRAITVTLKYCFVLNLLLQQSNFRYCYANNIKSLNLEPFQILFNFCHRLFTPLISSPNRTSVSTQGQSFPKNLPRTKASLALQMLAAQKMFLKRYKSLSLFSRFCGASSNEISAMLH